MMRKFKHIKLFHGELKEVAVNGLKVTYIEVPHDEYVRMFANSHQPERLNPKTLKEELNSPNQRFILENLEKEFLERDAIV